MYHEIADARMIRQSHKSKKANPKISIAWKFNVVIQRKEDAFNLIHNQEHQTNEIHTYPEL